MNEVIDKKYTKKFILRQIFKSEYYLNLTGNSFKLLIYMIYRYNETYCISKPTIKELKTKLKISVNTIKRCIVELESSNLISVYRTPNRIEYMFNFTSIEKLTKVSKIDT